MKLAGRQTQVVAVEVSLEEVFLGLEKELLDWFFNLTGVHIPVGDQKRSLEIRDNEGEEELVIRNQYINHSDVNTVVSKAVVDVFLPEYKAFLMLRRNMLKRSK